MRKDEMQSHAAEAERLTSAASASERAGAYRDAIRTARSAWPHIDGTLQFGRRYQERKHKGVEAIDVVVRCAPVLLDHHSLSAVGTLLADCKRIERETCDYAEAVAAAAVRLDDNYRLWSDLYQNGEVVQSELRGRLGGNQDAWRATADTWAAIGLVRRTPRRNSYAIELSTRLGEVVQGKCPQCGHRAEAPKSMFFEPIACAACGSETFFVICATTS